MIAGVPDQGGATWAVLQYLLGLRDLGHEVVFIEPVPAASRRPEDGPLARTANAAYFERVCDEFGLRGSAAIFDQETRETVGLSYACVAEIARRADVLINIAGMLTDPELMRRHRLELPFGFDPETIPGIGNLPA